MQWLKDRNTVTMVGCALCDYIAGSLDESRNKTTYQTLREVIDQLREHLNWLDIEADKCATVKAGSVTLCCDVYQHATKAHKWVARIESRPIGRWYWIDFGFSTKRAAFIALRNELREAVQGLTGGNAE